MDSSLSTYWVDRKGDLIPPWKELQRGRLQQGCTFVRYVRNHSRERIVSHDICLSMVRKSSNAVIVQNVTADKRNWKPTYFITTQMKTENLPKRHWPVHIVLRCLGDLSTWAVTSLSARKNLSKQPSLTWKPWCLKWLLLRGSIDRS